MKNWLGWTSIVLLVGVAPAVKAQDAAVKIGDTRLIPSVQIGYQSSDNAFRENQDPVDETGFSVTPKVRWEASQGRIAIAAQYEGELYASSEDSLDRTWHTLLFQGVADATSRHRFTTSFSIRDLTESLDEGFSRQRAPRSLEELVRFRNLNALLGYTFGAPSARGNLRFELLAASRSYLNLDAITAGGDYTVLRPAVDFSYRVGGDSRAFLAFRHATIDYDRDGSDRTELSTLVGVRMNEGRKLSGDVAVGVAVTDFDDATDETAAIVEVGLNYEATSFSSFNLDVSREFVNDDGQASVSSGSATIQTNAALTWQFEWSSRVATTARVEYTGNARTCAENDNTILEVGIEARYQFRRWLAFGVGIDRESNSVDLCPNAPTVGTLSADIDYERTTAAVFLRASL